MAIKIVTPPEVQKAHDELKKQGFDVKLTEPKKTSKKEKKKTQKQINQALKEMAEIEKEEFEKEMIRQTGGE